MSSTKKKNIILGILGTILSLLWLSPFYLMVVNSVKTKNLHLSYHQEYSLKTTSRQQKI